jgi:FtsZ-interacting cell division protein YlmF
MDKLKKIKKTIKEIPADVIKKPLNAKKDKAVKKDKDDKKDIKDIKQDTEIRNFLRGIIISENMPEKLRRAHGFDKKTYSILSKLSFFPTEKLKDFLSSFLNQSEYSLNYFFTENIPKLKLNKTFQNKIILDDKVRFIFKDILYDIEEDNYNSSMLSSIKFDSFDINKIFNKLSFFPTKKLKEFLSSFLDQDKYYLKDFFIKNIIKEDEEEEEMNKSEIEEIMKQHEKELKEQEKQYQPTKIDENRRSIFYSKKCLELNVLSNTGNSCYLDSVIMALFAKPNNFIDSNILKSDIKERNIFACKNNIYENILKSNPDVETKKSTEEKRKEHDIISRKNVQDVLNKLYFSLHNK